MINMHKQNKKKNRMDPALRAALVLLFPATILRLLITPLAFFWMGVLLQLFIYVLCGYMAANAYYESIRRIYPKGRPAESVRTGAKSGITLGILLSILLIFLTLLLGWLLPIIGGGLGLAKGMAFVFLVPVDILGGLFLGALGGKISATNLR